MADRQVPFEGVQGDFVEDLGHEPHVFVDDDPLTVAEGDARGLLAAVLERVETEVGQFATSSPGAQTPNTPQASCGPRSKGSMSRLRRPSGCDT